MGTTLSRLALPLLLFVSAALLGWFSAGGVEYTADGGLATSEQVFSAREISVKDSLRIITEYQHWQDVEDSGDAEEEQLTLEKALQLVGIERTGSSPPVILFVANKNFEKWPQGFLLPENSENIIRVVAGDPIFNDCFVLSPDENATSVIIECVESESIKLDMFRS